MAIPELEQERVSRALRRYCDKVPLHIRDKLTKDFRFVRSDVELFERRLPGGTDECVPKRDQQAPRSVSMDVGVGSAEVAQGLLDSERSRLEEEPLVSRSPVGSRHSEAHFERHVEPGRTTACR